MTIYQFPPCPSFGLGEGSWGGWQGGFTHEDIEKIRQLQDTLPTKKGVTFGTIDKDNPTEHDDVIRSSLVSWIKLSSETDWIYNRLANIARAINGRYFDFDLYGFGEDLQLSLYSAREERAEPTTVNDHYGWHIDSGETKDPSQMPRKLSIIVQLSDPSEYEGGEVQLLRAINPETLPKDKGLTIGFPSHTLHRVLPVTKGTRRSLVAWITGPRFK